MEPAILRLMIFCAFILSVSLVSWINQDWVLPLVGLWLWGWIFYKIIRVHLPPKANLPQQITQESPDTPQTVLNRENADVEPIRPMNKKPSFFHSPKVRPYFPALFFLCFLLAIAFGEAIWPRHGGMILADYLLMFSLIVVFVLYPLFKKAKKIRANRSDWKTSFNRLLYKEQQATEQIAAVNPGKIQRAKRNAFWLNVFLFMISPILFTLSFEVLPDALRGVRRSGADSAATAYAILMVFTVFGGVTIILLYFFTGIVIQLIRFFTKNKKEISPHQKTPDTKNPLSKDS